MRKNLVTLFILMLGSINLINAQDQITNFCGIDGILERIYNDPVLLQQYEDNKNPYTGHNLNRINCNRANRVNIPLAFHFDSLSNVRCSDSACILSEIQDAINTLNDNFGDNRGSVNATYCQAAYEDSLMNSVISTGACVNFYLAAAPDCSGFDPICDGAITIGKFKGGTSSLFGDGTGAGVCWDDYLNVFIQTDAIASVPWFGYIGLADQIPGYITANGPGEGVSLIASTFGGTDGACGPFDNHPTFNLGGVLTHEIGHYLGAPHIWGDVNNGGCAGDDDFADTPDQAAPFDTSLNLACPTNCIPSGCGGFQQTANFMNYSASCWDMFTEDQADAMNFYANQIFGHLNIPVVDPATCAQNLCCVDVNLEIFFDEFPGQTTWDITDVNGNVVASGGPYPNEPDNSTLNISLSSCLNDGCYTLNFYDSLNNGMCPFQQSIGAVGTFVTSGTLITPGTIVGTLGTVVTPGLCGNYNLTDANGTSLASGGGGFGAQETNSFCLANGLSPRLGSKKEHNTRVDILPNPASNFITIRHNMNTDVDIKFIDLSGRTVLANAMNQLELSTYQFDVSNLNTGVYMIHVESAENTAVEKFIKK